MTIFQNPVETEFMIELSIGIAIGVGFLTIAALLCGEFFAEIEMRREKDVENNSRYKLKDWRKP